MNAFLAFLFPFFRALNQLTTLSSRIAASDHCLNAILFDGEKFIQSVAAYYSNENRKAPLHVDGKLLR